MLPVLASVVAVLLVWPAAVPAQLRSGADPLRAVGDGAAWVLSYDPRPFRGTTLNRYLVPQLAGDRALLTHPQAPNIERLVAAGTLADLPAWQVLAASGVFVAAPSRPRSALLAGTGAKVGYAHPLGGARPGGPGRFAVTYAHRLVLSSLAARFAPARGDVPLVAYARGFMQPEPVLWGAVRVDDFSVLAGSVPAEVAPMLPAGAEIGVAHLFFGVRSRVSGDTRVVLDFEDAATAHAVGLLVRDALGDLARDGLRLPAERLRTEGPRVELRFRVDARLLRRLGDLLATRG